mgnify:CR=1 FL=1
MNKFRLKILLIVFFKDFVITPKNAPNGQKVLTIFEYPHGSSLTYYESLVTIQGQISEFIDSRFFSNQFFLNSGSTSFINHGFLRLPDIISW